MQYYKTELKRLLVCLKSKLLPCLHGHNGHSSVCNQASQYWCRGNFALFPQTDKFSGHFYFCSRGWTCTLQLLAPLQPKFCDIFPSDVFRYLEESENTFFTRRKSCSMHSSCSRRHRPLCCSWLINAALFTFHIQLPQHFFFTVVVSGD